MKKKYNDTAYLSAKNKSIECINTIIELYIQSKPTEPSIIKCWEYLNDIFYLTKDDFINNLTTEEKEILEIITLDRFINPIRSMQTFPIYLTNNNFIEKLRKIGVKNN